MWLLRLSTFFQWNRNLFNALNENPHENNDRLGMTTSDQIVQNPFPEGQELTLRILLVWLITNTMLSTPTVLFGYPNKNISTCVKFFNRKIRNELLVIRLTRSIVGCDCQYLVRKLLDFLSQLVCKKGLLIQIFFSIFNWVNIG